MEFDNYDTLKLEKLADEIKQTLNNQNSNYLCPNHDLEIYLYEYYVKPENYNIIDKPLHRIYYELAKRYSKLGNKEKMIENFEEARKYNPLDLEILGDYIKSNYKLNNYEKMLSLLREMYPYIYTRFDMSEYYSLLACYYLDSYKPDIAEALYMYSNIFYKNKQASLDLEYIDNAVNRKMADYSPAMIQEYLRNHGFFIQPNHKTLGLLYEVSKKSLNEGNKEYAGQLLFALYELTGDKDVLKMLNNIN